MAKILAMTVKAILPLVLVFGLGCANAQRQPNQAPIESQQFLKCKLSTQKEKEFDIKVPIKPKVYWGLMLNDLNVQFLFNYKQSKDLLKIKVREGYPKLNEEYQLSFSAVGTSDSFNFLNIGENSYYIKCSGYY